MTSWASGKRRCNGCKVNQSADLRCREGAEVRALGQCAVQFSLVFMPSLEEESGFFLSVGKRK